MIPNLTSIIAIMIVATPLLVFIMFLPALVELKKPKDGGPRRIMECLPEVQAHVRFFICLANIEEEQNFNSSLVQTIAKITRVLPNLEF